MKDVVIPNDVTRIGSLAFDGCTGLTPIEILHSVTEIGDYAFSGIPHIINNSPATTDDYRGAKRRTREKRPGIS